MTAKVFETAAQKWSAQMTKTTETFNTARRSQTAVPTAKRECVPKEDEMTQTIEEKNKAFVLEAFEALFNKRDYAAAERFWSPSYIQHSKHIPPGRDGLFGLIKSVPETMRYENGAILAEGNLLMLHGRITGLGLPANWISGGYRASGERPLGRALGRHRGRGHARDIRQRPADVRPGISVGMIQRRFGVRIARQLTRTPSVVVCKRQSLGTGGRC